MAARPLCHPAWRHHRHDARRSRVGCFGVNPYQVDNLTQITLASNIGTFLVYGGTCVIALVAFASRHDRHLVKHIAIPGVGAAMNIIEMLAVFYIAFSEGTGTTPGNAEKALGAVLIWVVLGFIWVKVNPNRHHARKVLDEKPPPTPAPPQVPVAT